MEPDRSSSEQSESATDLELTTRECWELLRTQAYGRLAIIDEDGPMIYPINALVDHGTLVFRTTTGGKLNALRDDDRVSFEVDGVDADNDDAWSVVIRGSARPVTNQYEEIEVVELGVTPWQHGPKPVFVRVTPDVVTGRRFHRVQRDAWTVPGVQPRRSPDE